MACTSVIFAIDLTQRNVLCIITQGVNRNLSILMKNGKRGDFPTKAPVLKYVLTTYFSYIFEEL